MSDIQKEFEATLNYVKTAEGDFQPSNEQKLEVYALFKQSTEGDVSGKRPGMMDFVARAKFDAWEKLKGISKDDAMQRYVSTINDLKNK